VILLLLVGLVCGACGVILVARAAGMTRTRTVETLGTIDSYGFVGSQAEDAAGGSVRASLDSVANAVGGIIGARLGALREPELRNQLMAAGLYSVTPRKFIGYRALAAFTAFTLWVWFGSVESVPSLLVLIGAPVSLLLGWTAPLSFLKRKAERRLGKIDYDLPELIDLLVVTVEAGLGFNSSLQIASGRLPGPLGEELRLALQEQSMGLGTTDALRNMLSRAETPAMRSFVRSILQGETLGVSIGQIMRNLAVEMRKRRRQGAEERAHKAPVKILFPLIFLIFPAMFVVLLAPAIFSFLEAFGNG
jgi:tight adherence protein C